VSRLGVRAPEAAVLAVLALVGGGPLVLMLWHAGTGDAVFAGADGPFPGDQFQYFAWIREFAGGLLAANTLDLAPSDRVFLHPMFLLSGLGVRLGLGVELAFQLWKPVALAALFLGARAYVARFVTVPSERAGALAIALLFASPLLLLAGDDLLAASGELLSAALLWGYLPAAISVGLMGPFLLGVERLAEAPEAGRRLVVALAACGALVSWLHPWQGQVLLVTVVAALALLRRPGRRPVELGVVLAATLAPLLYYFALSRADDAWALAAEANEAIGGPPVWTVLLALAPLAVPAAFGARVPVRGAGEAMLLLWAPSGVLVFLFLSPSFAQHALEGLAIPLGVLAVRGLRRFGRPAVAAAVALLVVPGTVYVADWLRDTATAPGEARYLRPGEQRALTALEASGRPGGVLASARLGALVPSATDRPSWVGHPSWTPDYGERARLAAELLGGRLAPDPAARRVRRHRRPVLWRDAASRRLPASAAS
jgi:hypothetical protein